MSGITDLASKGRNGDNTLMHVSTDEVAGLNALARESMGRELTTNPDTGLPEAFMFAPLLAPMVAGGMGLGGSAIATGLAAGALGAAEAEARDMDDPLRRGLYSGLTAGAASGIGNALSGAAEAGQAAGQAGGSAGEAAATTAGSGPDLSQAVETGPSAGNMMSVPNQSMPGSGFTPPPSPGQATSNLGLSPSAPTQLTQPTSTGSMTLDPQQAFQQSQYSDAPQMLEGAKNIFRDEGARQQFMEQAKGPAIAGSIGLGGQAQMRAQDEMKSRQEAADAESAAERKAAQDRIRANYAAVGRPMPTGFDGGPLFAGGGIVGLRRGGGVGGDGGGRAANNGGMGSSSGGGGGGRGASPSRSTPGSPNAADGRRGASMGPSGGSATGRGNAGSSMNPQAIESAVIGPGDKLAEGINSLVGMTLMGRVANAINAATTDSSLADSGPHGPGAPPSKVPGRDPSMDNSDMGARGNAPPQPSQPSVPQQLQPTLPLMAERQPTPNEDKFLAALQQGAGNQAAMQQTGYGMAQGGYLDGGMLPGDGMSDDVPANIDGEQPAALSSGEFVVPADVVSHIGNGSSDAGAKELYSMMDRIREARTGRERQAPEVNPKKMMPK